VCLYDYDDDDADDDSKCNNKSYNNHFKKLHSSFPPLLLCTPTLFPPQELDGFNYPLKKKTHLNFILKGTSQK